MIEEDKRLDSKTALAEVAKRLKKVLNPTFFTPDEEQDLGPYFILKTNLTGEQEIGLFLNGTGEGDSEGLGVIDFKGYFNSANIGEDLEAQVLNQGTSSVSLIGFKLIDSNIAILIYTEEANRLSAEVFKFNDSSDNKNHCIEIINPDEDEIREELENLEWNTFEEYSGESELNFSVIVDRGLPQSVIPNAQYGYYTINKNQHNTDYNDPAINKVKYSDIACGLSNSINISISGDAVGEGTLNVGQDIEDNVVDIPVTVSETLMDNIASRVEHPVADQNTTGGIRLYGEIPTYDENHYPLSVDALDDNRAYVDLSEINNRIDSLGNPDVHRYRDMNDATRDHSAIGSIVQYIGETDDQYTKGYFYIRTSEGLIGDLQANTYWGLNIQILNPQDVLNQAITQYNKNNDYILNVRENLIISPNLTEDSTITDETTFTLTNSYFSDTLTFAQLKEWGLVLGNLEYEQDSRNNWIATIAISQDEAQGVVWRQKNVQPMMSVDSPLVYKGTCTWSELEEHTSTAKIGDFYTVSDKSYQEYFFTGAEGSVWSDSWEFMGQVVTVPEYTGSGHISVNNHVISDSGLQETLTEGNNIDITNNTISALGYTYDATKNSFAEGNSTASGQNSHAEGGLTEASGIDAHSEGYGTIADENYSHAEGYLTVAQNEAEHAEGKYNVSHKVSPIEFVDMGVSVLWAKCNLGAAVETDPGDLYAWGEITPKTEFSWSNYRFGTQYALTKYNSTDNLITLQAEDDAATVSYGNGWRMSSESELVELWNNCSAVWDSNGVTLTSRINGNTLYFPYNYYDTQAYTPSNWINIWHRNRGSGLSSDYSAEANSFKSGTNSPSYVGWYSQRFGPGCIRPVSEAAPLRLTRHSIGIGSSSNDKKNAFEVMDNGDAYLYGVGNYDGATIKTFGNNVQTLQDVLGTIPAAQVNADWNASSGVAEILNKPTIPTVNNAKLTIKKSSSDTGTEFTANASTDVTCNLGLAAVASSGSYTDLSNTPSIPAAQIQADWNQTNTSALDYIQNKPTIPTVNDATYSIKTDVSGTETTVSDFTANQSTADSITFVQGSNVTLTPDAANGKITIAATDTTYSDFAGSTHGLVPGASSGDAGKFLKADGSWDTPASGGTVTSVAAGNGLKTADGNAITSSGTILLDEDVNTTAIASPENFSGKKYNGVFSVDTSQTIAVTGNANPKFREVIYLIYNEDDTSSITVAISPSSGVSAINMSGSSTGITIPAEKYCEIILTCWSSTLITYNFGISA